MGGGVDLPVDSGSTRSVCAQCDVSFRHRRLVVRLGAAEEELQAGQAEQMEEGPAGDSNTEAAVASWPPDPAGRQRQRPCVPCSGSTGGVSRRGLVATMSRRMTKFVYVASQKGGWYAREC